MENILLIVFLFIVLFSYTLQGITGFAGTILAMTPSIYLIGYDIAKPTLNIIGVLSGLYVVILNYKDIDWKELRKIILLLIVGLGFGFLIKNLPFFNSALIYLCFALFVLFMSLKGILKVFFSKDFSLKNKSLSFITLIFVGIIHFLFVSGGPILVGYTSEKIPNKLTFRATISMIWVILNGIILISDISMSYITLDVIKYTALATPILFLGMYIGNKLFHRLSQDLFMKVSYILMLIMSILLLINI